MHCGVRAWYHQPPAMRPAGTRFWSPVDYESLGGARAASRSPTPTRATLSPGPEAIVSSPDSTDHQGTHRQHPATLSAYHPYLPCRPSQSSARLSPSNSARTIGEYSPPLVHADGTRGIREHSPGSAGRGCDWAMKYRDTHVLSEQKRRNNIKDGFDGLQASIPGCPTNATKADILRLARQRIIELEAMDGNTGQMEGDLQNTLSATNSFVDLLKREYAALAKEKATLLNTVEQLQKEKEELMRQCDELSKSNESK